MMLRESYALADAAEAVESAVRLVWRRGWRTDDLGSSERESAGTRAMGELVAEAVAAGPDRTE
jgi:3-isopropylmalate dehydrogenase